MPCCPVRYEAASLAAALHMYLRVSSTWRAVKVISRHRPSARPSHCILSPVHSLNTTNPVCLDITIANSICKQHMQCNTTLPYLLLLLRAGNCRPPFHPIQHPRKNSANIHIRVDPEQRKQISLPILPDSSYPTLHTLHQPTRKPRHTINATLVYCYATIATGISATFQPTPRPVQNQRKEPTFRRPYLTCTPPS